MINPRKDDGAADDVGSGSGQVRDSDRLPSSTKAPRAYSGPTRRRPIKRRGRANHDLRLERVPVGYKLLSVTHFFGIGPLDGLRAVRQTTKHLGTRMEVTRFVRRRGGYKAGWLLFVSDLRGATRFPNLASGAAWVPMCQCVQLPKVWRNGIFSRSSWKTIATSHPSAASCLRTTGRGSKVGFSGIPN